jgi:hypothetical protein
MKQKADDGSLFYWKMTNKSMLQNGRDFA